MPSVALPSVVVTVAGARGPTVLLPGDLIGRSPAAALDLDDPRVSEVHAYVSLRGGELVLFGLRGRLGVGGEIVRRVVLRRGLRVQLARDLELEVVRVNLPDRVLALEGTGLARQALEGTCSLVFDPLPSVVPGFVSGAALHLWTHDGDWRARTRGGAAVPVTETARWTFGECEVRALWVDVRATGSTPTEAAGRLRAPLVLRARYDSVQIERDDEVALVVSGRGAQLLSELVAFDGPVRWQTLAAEIWGHDAEPHTLRGKLDVTVRRLRRKLAAAELPPDLVFSDGTGQYQLVLGPSDQVHAAL